MIFGFFGEFMGIAGGSLNQVLIPLTATIAFLRTRQHASAAVTVGRFMFGLGAMTMLAALGLLGLDLLRAWREPPPEDQI